jgi:superfamily II DNA or RNA helicase
MIHHTKNISMRDTDLTMNSGQWASRLSGSFLPVIKERGERYARESRVLLQEVSNDRIAGTVRGTIAYEVELFVVEEGAEKGAIKSWCNCPFFKQGFPCKHLWAAILEADRILELSGAAVEKARSGSHVAQSDREEKEIDRNWRRFFSSDVLGQVEADASLDISSGNFMPVYNLHVGERELLFSAVERYVKKDGTLGRKRRISFSSASPGSVPAPDRILMAVVEQITRESGSYMYYGSTANRYEDVVLHQNDLGLLLPLLADTGRCVVHFWKKGVVADPLTRGRPFDAGFRLKAENLSPDQPVRLVPLFLVPSTDPETGAEIETELSREKIDCIFNTTPLMFIAGGKLYQVRDIPFSWISRVYPLEYIEVPEEDIADFVKTADTLPVVPEIELPEKLAPITLDSVEPSPVVVVEFDQGQVSLRLAVEYDGLEIDWQDRRDAILDPDRWVRISRNRVKEQHFVTSLTAEGFRQEGDVFVRGLKNLARVLSTLEENNFRIEAANRKKIHSRSKAAFSVSSGVDWFDLEGHISFGDAIIPLPRAISEFLKGSSTVRLDDGSFGLLPVEWLEKHASMLEMALPAGKAGKGDAKLRFPSSRALLIDALLEEAENVRVDRDFAALRDAMKDFSGIERQSVPEQFHGTLRPYQQDTLGWFGFLEKMNFGGILADDMGLGKTVQVLAWLARFIQDERQGEGGSSVIRTTLIVVPTSLVFNWKSEAARFVPSMKVLVYGGSDREELLDKISDHHLVITTYGLMRRDIEKLREIPFEYVILDESQAIKNPASQTARAARLLRAAHRLCLTGTPLENNVGELWSQMEFLNPGILGSRAAFERKFLKPIDRDDEKALETLKTIVRPFILRRTKELVASELPEKMEQTVFCVMPPAQADIYTKLRDHFRTSILSSVENRGMNRSKIKVLEALLRLRQAANHPALVGHEDVHSGKLDELMQLVDEAVAGGHKALVFSQFTRMLALIRKGLDQRGIVYEYLDGRVPQKMREDRVTRFQEDDRIKLFLISLKAGGVGLNLTAADYVFIVDPWWNPAVELQAVDRTHRIGQDKRVFTYRFITTDTVEEKVLALQKQKQEMVSSILSGSGDMLKKLSAQDLEVLFS